MAKLSDKLAALINQIQESDRRQQEVFDGLITTTRRYIDDTNHLLADDSGSAIQDAIDLLVSHNYEVIAPE